MHSRGEYISLEQLHKKSHNIWKVKYESKFYSTKPEELKFAISKQELKVQRQQLLCPGGVCLEARLHDTSSILMWFWVSCRGSVVSKKQLNPVERKVSGCFFSSFIEENFALKCIKNTNTGLCLCNSFSAVFSQSRKPVFSRWGN